MRNKLMKYECPRVGNRVRGTKEKSSIAGPRLYTSSADIIDLFNIHISVACYNLFINQLTSGKYGRRA